MFGMLPQPSDSYRWTQTAAGPALVCTALEPFARHLFTTRSWALGTDSADRAAGWAEVAAVIDVDPEHLIRAHQVHGASVIVRHRGAPKPSNGGALQDADILITDDPAVALAIQTADCVPLLIADRRTGAVAAAHAGWRGLAARVPIVAVQALSREFRSQPEDLIVAIGPSISAPRYEVGADVRQRFEAAGFDHLDRVFHSGMRPGHWQFDGWQSASDQLETAGVPAAQIHLAELCTAANPEVLCSYRRDGKGAGRIAAVIRALQSRA
jgi:polyphenol oxidase